MLLDNVQERIQHELGSVMDRLRQLGGAVLIEEFPGSAGEGGPLADPIDLVQVREEWEIGALTRSLLVERANRLAEALERVQQGTYGLCDRCGEAIAPARLRAMPEVTTCVHCQDRLERNGRHLA